MDQRLIVAWGLLFGVQLGVTPDVRGVTAGPAMMQPNQVSLRKVLQLKMFPGLSYLVVAASPRQGCLLERRRCWVGWVLLWVVLWLVPPNVRRFEHFAGESKNIKQNMLMNTISHPHIASALAVNVWKTPRGLGVVKVGGGHLMLPSDHRDVDANASDGGWFFIHK